MPNAQPVADAPVASRRFRPRALPTLATIAAVAVFVAAGHWQQGRMQEKEALRAQQDAATNAAPIALASLPAAADWPALRYRPVVATGEYDARRQVFVDNRVHDGRAGYHVSRRSSSPAAAPCSSTEAGCRRARRAPQCRRPRRRRER